jgi:hypothetical protein
MNVRRSALMVSALVVHTPCARPGWIFPAAFLIRLPCSVSRPDWRALQRRRRPARGSGRPSWC